MSSPLKNRVPVYPCLKKRHWKSIFQSLVALGICFPFYARAQNATFEFTGNMNAVSAQPSGGTFSTLTRTGVTAEAANNEFSSSAWNQGSTFDPSQYVSFSLTPSAGNVSFVKSLVFDVAKDSKGPENMEVRLLGVSSSSVFGSQAVALGKGAKSVTNQLFDFKDTITADSLSFRFYGKDADSKRTDGTLSLDNVATTSGSANFAPSDAAITLTEDTNFYADSTALNLLGDIGGGYGLDKIGGNVATFSGTNTYTGATTITSGTLRVGAGGVGSITSAVIVSSGATLAGSGTINGNVTVNSGARYAPGEAGIGTQTINGNLSLAGSSIFSWELAAPVGSSPSGNQGTYDKVVLSGALSGTSVFNIGLLGSNNSFSDPFWSANKTWSDVFTLGSGTLQSVFTNFGGAGVATDGTVGSVGKFSFSGNTLNFTSFSTVPEPTSALAGLLVVAGLLRRARR